MRLSGKEMAMACQGRWIGEIPEWITGLSTDSREFTPGQVFLALRGLNFDGHSHAKNIADKAMALIGDIKGVASWQALLQTPQLEVEDTLTALGDIAACHRATLKDTVVIAITGSYGKTTVRSMLSHVLATLGVEVAATKANFNNLIGVPKTLLAIEPTAEVAVVECGISELGEMERLSEIVQPDIAMITGLSHAHGQGLGGLTGVAQEKAKLLNHLSPQGWCALGLGVAEQLNRAKCNTGDKVLDMDTSPVVWSLDGRRLTMEQAAETAELLLPLPAKHWAEDMALVAAVTLELGSVMNRQWTLSQVTAALETWSSVEGRMCVYAQNEARNYTLIDDSYNANPASMQAALDTLAKLEGHRVAVLGDMLELGDLAAECHQQLNLHDIDEVILVGPLMSGLVKVNPQREMRCFENASALLDWIKEQQHFPVADSTALLKSSHGSGLYQVADYLRHRGQHVT